MATSRNRRSRQSRQIGEELAAVKRYRDKILNRDTRLVDMVHRHVQWRHDCVARFLVIFERLCQHMQVRWVKQRRGGALLQQFQAGMMGLQAAHCMPCQVLINGRFPWNLLSHPDYVREVSRLFAKCTQVRAIVNFVDTYLDHFQQGADTFVRCLEDIQAGGSRDDAYRRFCDHYVTSLLTTSQRYSDVAAAHGELDEILNTKIHGKLANLSDQIRADRIGEVCAIELVAQNVAIREVGGWFPVGGVYDRRMDREGWFSA